MRAGRAERISQLWVSLKRFSSIKWPVFYLEEQATVIGRDRSAFSFLT